MEPPPPPPPRSHHLTFPKERSSFQAIKVKAAKVQVSPPRIVTSSGEEIGSQRDGVRKRIENQSSQQPRVGARLGQFWQAWEKHPVDPWVISVLKQGYQIPFHHPPPLALAPQEFPSYLGNQEKFTALEQEVLDMLSKDAIEEVSGQNPGFYNRLFLVKKASGSWRPVLDVSRLNKYVTKPSFPWRPFSPFWTPSSRTTG